MMMLCTRCHQPKHVSNMVRLMRRRGELASETLAKFARTFICEDCRRPVNEADIKQLEAKGLQ